MLIMPWYANIMSALSGRAIGLLRSASVRLFSGPDFKDLKNEARKRKKCLDGSGSGELGNSDDIKCAKDYIEKIEKYVQKAKDVGNFDGCVKLLAKYKDLAERANKLDPAVFNKKFEESINSVFKSMEEFVKYCQNVANKLEKAGDYEKMECDLIVECNTLSSVIGNTFKSYLQQKEIYKAFDIVKYCFAALSVYSEGNGDVGFLMQILSKVLHFTLGQLQEKRDKLSKKAEAAEKK